MSDDLLQRLAALERAVERLQTRESPGNFSPPGTLLAAGVGGAISTVAGLTYASSLLTVPGNVQADASTRIGAHPTYGSTYSGFWRSGADYSLLTDGSNTFVNAPSSSGNVYIRGANGNNPSFAAFNASTFFHSGLYTRVGSPTASNGDSYLYPNGNGNAAFLVISGGPSIDFFSTNAANKGSQIRLMSNSSFAGIGHLDLLAGNWSTGGEIRFYTQDALRGLWKNGNFLVGADATYLTNQRLRVIGSDATSGNYVAAFANSTQANLMYLRNDGYAWVNQNWAVGSTGAAKANIKKLAKDTARFKQLAKLARRFTYRGSDQERIGFIYEDVAPDFPELAVADVMEGADADGTPIRQEIKGLLYNDMLPWAMVEIDEQDNRIAALEKQVVDQAKIIEALSKRLAALEKQQQ